MRWLTGQGASRSDSDPTPPHSSSHTQNGSAHTPLPLIPLASQPGTPLCPHVRMSEYPLGLKLMLLPSTICNLNEGKREVQQLYSVCSQKQVFALCLLRGPPPHLRGPLPGRLRWEDVLVLTDMGTCVPQHFCLPLSVFRKLFHGVSNYCFPS